MAKKIMFITIVCLSLFANAERDFLTRISDIQCKNEKNVFDLKWDSAETPLGPIVFNINGKDYAAGLRMTFQGELTSYETTNGYVFDLNSKTDHKSSFSKKIKINGVEEKFSCTYKTSLKFFRERHGAAKASVNQEPALK